MLTHSADDPAPLVVGHPKTNAPAYGWTDQLKREGNTLFAKATDVAEEFSDAVAARHYRKRSISIMPDGNGGYKLRHIGFLGAAAPAVAGLKDISFSEAEATTFEYSIEDAVRRTAWSLSSIGRALRSIRDKIISDDGLEKADELIPNYQIESIQENAASAQQQLDSSPTVQKHYSSTDDASQESKRMEYTQADLDAAVKNARDEGNKKIQQMEFESRKATAETLISAAVSRGAVTPAQSVGLAEFVAGLPDEDAAAFEFSEGESEEVKKQTPYQYFSQLLESLGPQVKLGEDGSEEPDISANDYSVPDGYTVSTDRAELTRKAEEFSKANGVSFEVALEKVAL